MAKLITDLKLGLGVQAKDKITGFEGIVTSKVEYLTGCTQFGIAPPSTDGKVHDTCYFDWKRLEVTGVGISADDVSEKEEPGGTNRDAPKL